MAPEDENPLLAQLVAASGLAPVIAAGAIGRCCARAGLVPERLTRADVARLLPLLEPLLGLYLKPDEQTAARRRLQDLAR